MKKYWSLLTSAATAHSAGWCSQSARLSEKQEVFVQSELQRPHLRERGCGAAQPQRVRILKPLRLLDLEVAAAAGL